MNEYTVSPEVLRFLKAGLPPRRRPAFPKVKPWEERTQGQGQGKTYCLGAVLPGVAQGAGRAFAVGPVARAAADPATAGRISPDLTGPQLVLADLQHPSPADVPVARRQAGAGGRGMAAAAQERCVTAWPPSWGSANASPPPSTGSGLRTDGGRLSPFCLRTHGRGQLLHRLAVAVVEAGDGEIPGAGVEVGTQRLEARVAEGQGPQPCGSLSRSVRFTVGLAPMYLQKGCRHKVEVQVVPTGI